MLPTRIVAVAMTATTVCQSSIREPSAPAKMRSRAANAAALVAVAMKAVIGVGAPS